MAVVIPCHNEATTIGRVVVEARRQVDRVIVVDDGSADGTAAVARRHGAEVIRLSSCHGKGAALKAGFRRARELGCAWVVSLDGDGQHAPGDIPRFVRVIREGDIRLVVGNRMGGAETMPWLRRQVNRFMSRVLSRVAGRELPDSQCGFRLMHLGTWSSLATRARHFEFESELLLAFARAGHEIRFVPIAAVYRNERSKIRPLRDAFRWFRWLSQVHRPA